MHLSTKAKRIAIAFVLVISATTYITLRFWVKPPPPPVSVPPSVQLLESRLIGRKDGAKQWEILTQSVLQAENLVTLTDMDEITMFQGEEPYLSIQAQGATWDRKKDILNLKESVVVEGDDGFRLESDLLIWDGVQETLTSPGPVVVLWQGMEIKAAEMVMESKSNLLYLKNDVEIRDGSMVWRLDNVVYDLDQELMSFYGSLVAEGEVGDHE